ncbi:MAG: TerC family protein [Egibacteraceae bacterium]
MLSDPVLYLIFTAVVAALLAIDLFVVQRDPHAVSMKEATIWSAIWIGVAVVFGLFITQFHEGGSRVVVEYFTGYVIEKSLSVDNVFVFVLIFGALRVPREYQHRVLFYGVLGAIVMRTILILTGAALVSRFEWILYIFGAFLLYVAAKTWRERNKSTDLAGSRLMKRLERVVPTTDGYRKEHFLVREHGKWLMTPLFVVLMLVEVSDLIFAVDSIPAIFAITQDPFIVLTSNIFAILGLRSLYFLVAGAADRLRYLNEGLAVILGFVGLKLLTKDVSGIWHPSPLVSLAIIGGILLVVIVASLLASRKDQGEQPEQQAKEVMPALAPRPVVRGTRGASDRHTAPFPPPD